MNKKVENYYDVKVSEIEEYENSLLSKLSFSIRLDKILQNINSNSQILDLGGGTGRYSLELAKNNHSVTLADFSSNSLKIAERKIEKSKLNNRIKMLQVNIEEYHFQENVYDCILCEGSVISYLSDTEKFIEKITKSLKDDGILILTAASLYGVLLGNSHIVKNLIFEENIDKLDYVKKVVVNKKVIEDKDFNLKINLYTSSDLTNLMKKENYEILDVYGRNVWDIFFEKDFLNEKLEMNAQEQIRNLELLLNNKKEVLDFCHSICVIGRKKKNE